MSYLVEQSTVVPGMDTDRGGLPLGAGSMRVIRRFESDEARDKFADRRIAEEEAEKQKEQDRMIVKSFNFFKQYKHTVMVESGDSKLYTRFPRLYACYSQAVEESHATKDATFFASEEGRHSIVTKISDIPDNSEVEAKVEICFGTAFDERTVGRALVGQGDEVERDILVEAELAAPFKLTPGTELRIVVQGGQGTDGSAKRTCAITSEMFLNSAQKLMAHREAILQKIRDFVDTADHSAEIRVRPLAQLNSSISFVLDDTHDSAGAAFLRNEPINFQGPDHAILTNFKLVMVEGVPSLASVTIAIRFVTPSSEA